MHCLFAKRLFVTLSRAFENSLFFFSAYLLHKRTMMANMPKATSAEYFYSPLQIRLAGLNSGYYASRGSKRLARAFRELQLEYSRTLISCFIILVFAALNSPFD